MKPQKKKRNDPAVIGGDDELDHVLVSIFLHVEMVRRSFSGFLKT